MLRSGDASAYWALVIAGLQLLARPADMLLASRETSLLKRTSTGNQPILLIVGAPRSGTTLVHQALTSVFDCSYFTNFDALFPRSTLVVAKLRKRLSNTRGDRANREAFSNFYGKTSGLNGANDAFHVWNRWLGDRHSVPETPISPDMAEDMAKFFSAWAREFPRPLINKNNRNSLCVSELAKALPASFFIVVERDPLFVAQSLYQARIQVHGDPSIGWGLRARKDAPGMDQTEDAVSSVCAQVTGVVQDLRKDLTAVPEERQIRIRYEDFCARPADKIAEISDAVREATGVDLRLREGMKPPESFPDANRQKLSDTLFREIGDRLGETQPPLDQRQ